MVRRQNAGGENAGGQNPPKNCMVGENAARFCVG